MTRLILLAPLTVLAACGGGAGDNASAPAGNAAGANAVQPMPSPTGPPPLTPRLDVPPQGNDAGTWLGPRAPNPATPTRAPYGNLLDQPVVNGTNP